MRLLVDGAHSSQRPMLPCQYSQCTCIRLTALNWQPSADQGSSRCRPSEEPEQPGLEKGSEVTEVDSLQIAERLGLANSIRHSHEWNGCADPLP